MSEGTTFGGWLKQRRRELGITQEELAERVGCSLITMQKIETGARRPSGQIAHLIAGYLGIPPDEREAFVAFARAGRAAPLPAQTEPGEAGTRAPWRNAYLHQTNLPAVLTTLIGRDNEVEAARSYLLGPKVRLLSMTGAPGIGKTRLALQVASDLVGHFEDGVFFVDLSPIVDPNMVLPTIARTLGLKELASPSPSSLMPAESVLLGYMNERKMLLVLDNFEQVLDAAGAIVKIMESSPWLKVLVTSREALHVRGERAFPVPPLGMPDPSVYQTGGQHFSGPDSLAHLAASPAVELFLARAQTVLPQFELTSGNAPDVAAICTELGGLPLAIELIAARAGHFSPGEMRAAIADRRSLSLIGSRDVPPRQRTLKSAFEWSYGLLSSMEQALFRRLSVFVQGCTLEAARAVCNADRGLGAHTPEMLVSLVEKNLLQRDSPGMSEEPRFRMLETMHRYAESKLTESRGLGAKEGPEEYETARAHAIYFMKLAEQAEPHLVGADQTRWLGKLEREHDNLRAALRWAEERANSESGEPPATSVELPGGVEIELRIAAALWRFWYTRGYIAEGRRFLSTALGVVSSLGSLPLSVSLELSRATALHGAGVLASEHGEITMAHSMVQASLDIRRRYENNAGIASSLNVLGSLAYMQGAYDEALALFSESLDTCRAIGDRAGIASALNNVGVLAIEQRDYARAVASHTESLAIKREIGDKGGAAVSLNNLANLACEQHDYATARSYHAESLAIKREIGDKRGIGMSLGNLGFVAFQQGYYSEAISLYRESLVIRQEIEDTFGACLSLVAIGRILTEEKEALQGARLLGAASALMRAMNVQPEADSRLMLEQGVVSAREQLADKEFEQAWSEGQTMLLNKAVESALTVE